MFGIATNELKKHLGAKGFVLHVLHCLVYLHKNFTAISVSTVTVVCVYLACTKISLLLCISFMDE